MTVNDKQAWNLRAFGKKWFAYPQHVFIRLLIKRNSWTNTRMHEKKVSHFEHDRKVGDKTLVTIRNNLCK